MRKPTDKTALVTHRGCLDGTGCAAMFVWAGGKRENVIFKTPSHCMLTADEAAPFDEVWFADLCPASLENPAAGLSFWVCDHHATNVKKFGDDERCTFSMTHSGTSLMARETGFIEDRWRDIDFLKTGDPCWMEDRVELVKALEAYDLGRFDNWKGQRMADAAGTMSQEQMLETILHHGTDVLYETGITHRAEAMSNARRIYAEKAAETAYYFEFKPPGWGYASGTVNAGVTVSPEPWKNACAEAILKRAELAIIVDSTSWSLSFRSHDLDVSSMAAEFGGGGHKRAAGFKIASHDVLRAVVEEIFG